MSFMQKMILRCLMAVGIISSMGVKAQPFDLVNIKRVESWLKPIDETSVKHSIEKRGFVEAPIDYNFRQGPTLKIAYRILPVTKVAGIKTEYFHPDSEIGKTKPLLIIMNGGPGASSEHLRKPSFIYDPNLTGDRLSEFTKSFRVVLVDQRGTSGRSSQIDFNNSDINAQLIADYFGPKQVALDHAAVIKSINPSNEDFYIVAQSYGGLIGANYLVEMEKDSKIPKPRVMALTSPGIQSAEEAFQRQLERRAAQRDLALQLKLAHPEIVELIPKLRARIYSVDPSSTIADSIATLLGRGNNWKIDFLNQVKSMVAMSDEELRKEIKADYATIDLFNHILSSMIITPGYTDRTIYTAIKDLVVLEDWMPDELRNYHNGRAELKWQNDFLDHMDLHPPKQSDMASLVDIQKAAAKNSVVVTGSVDDPLIPVTVTRRLAEFLKGPQVKYIEFKTGGHGAAFMSPHCDRLLTEGFKIY